MHDQATGLKDMLHIRPVPKQVLGETPAEPGVESKSLRAQVIAITSGKGGVGKTNIVVNLAAALALRGRKVLILDADFGLANVDVLLGLAPKYHLGHFLYGDKPLREILVQGPQGIPIIPAAPGVQALSQLDEAETEKLFTELNKLIEEYDFLLVDTGAGISDNVMRLLLACQRIIVVSSPDPTAVVDAYAVIKIVSEASLRKPIDILINQVDNPEQGAQVFEQISRVTHKFLAREVHYMGYVSHDEKLGDAVREQRAVVMEFPFSRASRCFRHLAMAMTPGPAKPNTPGPRLTLATNNSNNSAEIACPS
jgi:flagellar biosynthesis protein FlhG